MFKPIRILFAVGLLALSAAAIAQKMGPMPHDKSIDKMKVKVE